MADARQYSYVAVRSASNEVVLRPSLPITLSYGRMSQQAEGLLDTGADVNVLPYRLGIELGADWASARTGIRLSGNLAEVETRGLLLTANVADFPPVRLAFAWTRSERVPLILGQVNFFAEFEVCFFQSRNLFEVKPK